MHRQLLRCCVSNLLPWMLHVAQYCVPAACSLRWYRTSASVRSEAKIPVTLTPSISKVVERSLQECRDRQCLVVPGRTVASKYCCIAAANPNVDKSQSGDAFQ